VVSAWLGSNLGLAPKGGLCLLSDGNEENPEDLGRKGIIPIVPECLSFRPNWLLSPPFPASECAPPPPEPEGEGGEESQFG
jgi:hypothetical protein